jgi:hypothetical protein
VSEFDDVVKWYAKVLADHAGFIPDQDAKLKILAERDSWNAAALKPRSKQVAGVIALQWDQMVYLLAQGMKDVAPGWNAEWDDLSPTWS